MQVTVVKSKIHRVKVMGDILIAYGILKMDIAKNFKPSLVFPNEDTNLLN